MRRVLAAVDASPVAAEVMRAAVVFADVLGASPEGLHVAAEPDPGLGAQAAATGLRLVHRPGAPHAVIHQAMSEPGVVLGVLGTSGAGGARQRPGRVARAVLAGAPGPVVAVPPGSFPQDRRHVCRAVVPLDGRARAAAAVEPIVTTLVDAGVDVVLVHVVEDVDLLPLVRAHAARLGRTAHPGRRQEAEVPRRLHVTHGDPATVILDACLAEDAELVVVGWAQDLSGRRAATVRHLLAGSPVPVLLVPASSVATDLLAWEAHGAAAGST
ncbi:universal stress protein [Isoptericola sp. b441]|uniref:Universal stress protein n=1 Tax=Actinotalea lenta TaxID=3064654 RepID=A0ABT9DAB6_9CELL|nr:universal stress protein [Isoptericola sp. b441]MDO8107852.1 universal stress protein [Isoptericola sp. b441]